MSAFGRHWSLKVRGCTVAEHALLYRLGDRHHEVTGKCYPGRATLSFELECSKDYISDLFQSLDYKGFLKREARFDEDSGDQTSNNFLLNFDRWFPFYSEAVEREEKRIVGIFRRHIESPELAEGFHSVWMEKPNTLKDNDPKLKDRSDRNEFQRYGHTLRKNRKRPFSPVLWLALVSPEHERHYDKQSDQIKRDLLKDIRHTFKLKLLRTWLKKPSPTDFD